MKSFPYLAHVLNGLAMALASSVSIASGGGGGSSSMPNTLPAMETPRYDAAIEYRKGIEALRASHYEDADRAFSHVLQVTPRDANANFMAGLAKAALGKLKDARRRFEKAIKYDDNLIAAHQELGIVLAKLGETEKAKAVLDDLKQRATTCADTCSRAAALKQAVAAVEAALGAQPSSQIPALSSLFFASTQDGDHVYLDAVALINEHRYDEAIAALNASARAFGPHPDILTYLGFANRKSGRLAQAESYYRQALAVAPNHIGATEYYGELMVERGDLAGARRMLAKLDAVCTFGCAQADELRRWIDAASHHAS